MKINVGKLDAAIRISLAALFIVLYALDIIAGTLGIVLIAVSAIFLITGFTRRCPLFYLFGMNTCTRKTKTA